MDNPNIPDSLAGKLSTMTPLAQNIAMSSVFGEPKKKEEEKEEIQETIEALSQEEADDLSRKINDEFIVCKGARIVQEQNWIRAHQNYKGIYPADMDFGTGTSRAFVQVTRPKVQTAFGLLLPILSPPGSDVFTVDADPVSTDPKLVMNLLAQGVAPDVIKQQVQLAAEARAELMTKKVKDGLVETQWPIKLSNAVLECCLYGTGIVFGPLAVPKKTAVQAVEAEELNDADEYRPELEHISVFDFYPDPGARSVEEMDYAIIRRIVNRNQIRKYLKDETFREEAVQWVLDNYPNGNWAPEYWESIINITNAQQQKSAPNGRYVCLIRWGWLNGEELRKAGVDVPDDQLTKQAMCQVWSIGNKVIRLSVSDMYQKLGRLPFYVTPYSVVPHTPWGAGCAEMMFDSQDAINAFERAKMDNMALSSRPQAFVNMDRLVNKDASILEMKAGKVWAVKDSEMNSGDPIKWFSPDCRVGEIQASQDKHLVLAQEQVALPNLLMGLGGEGIHNRTSSGASMQFNAAVTPMKTTVFNFENTLIIPLIHAMAEFYKEFSNDDGIQGEYCIDARGVQGLMAREALMQTIQGFMAIIGQNVEWAKKVDMDQVFKLLIRYSGLVDENLTIPDSVLQQRQQAEAQAQQQAQQDQMAFEANLQMQNKIRAETSPKDVLLEAAKQAPDGGKLKITLLKKVLGINGLLDPEIEAAFEVEMEMEGFAAQNRAHQMGSEQALREQELRNAMGQAVGTGSPVNGQEPNKLGAMESLGGVLEARG